MAVILRRKGIEAPLIAGTLPAFQASPKGPAGEPQPSKKGVLSEALSDRLIAWLGTLTVTQGRHAGRPFVVLPWEQEFLTGAFAPEVNEAGLSVARGNGKTCLLAGVALAAVVEDGPLVEPNAETVIVAASLQQGRILFQHVLTFGGDRLRSKRYRILNNTQHGQIIDRETGASVKLIGSDHKKAHGLAPALTLADEPAQWEAGGDAMAAALKTSRGKIPGSRFIALGTRARSSLHWFSRMLASGGPDKYMQVHAADCLDDPADTAQWIKANPSLLHFPDLRAVIQSEARDAANDPGLLASFQSLRLNGGVSEVEGRDMLIQPALWKELLAQPEAPAEGRRAWGVDLGGSAAMSAVACCWETGRLETLAMFGSEPDLQARSLRDAVGELYETARLAGDLIVSGKRIPDIPALFEEAEARFGGRPDALVCDRWRIAELKDALDDPSWQAVPLIVRGQGFKDGSEDVRAWRRACAERKVHPVSPSILLTAALAEAVTVCDPAGNEKLAKDAEGGRRKNARDDVAAAAVLAVAHAALDKEQAPARVAYGGLV